MKLKKKRLKKKSFHLSKLHKSGIILTSLLGVFLIVIGLSYTYKQHPQVLSASVAETYGSAGSTGSYLDPSTYINQLSSQAIKSRLQRYTHGYDLSQYTPPAISQLPTWACVSFAMGYYGVGWYAKRDGYFPTSGKQGFAPMYIYSQIARGRISATTSPDTVANYLVTQGIDTRQDYSLSGRNPDNNYYTQPSSANKTNAANFKISGIRYLFRKSTNESDNNKIQAIKDAIILGDPVIIDVSMPSRLMSRPVMTNDGGGANQSGHDLFVDGFDDNGAHIINSWGPSWGSNGRATFPWKYLVKYTRSAFVIIPKAKPKCVNYSNGKCLVPTPTPIHNQALCTSSQVCSSYQQCHGTGGTSKNSCGTGWYCCDYSNARNY